MSIFKTSFKAIALGCIFAGMPIAAYSQSVTVQDISAQLQASLEANAPTVVYFDFDKDAITAETEAILLQQAAWLSQNPEAKVDLAGHTDAVGSNSYNDDLAMRRANAVNDFMLMHGVSQNQMRSVVSRGENELAVSTQKRERLNRRVTTYVTGLVELVAAPPPPPPPPIAATPERRSYAEFNLPVCDGRSRTALLDIGDIKTLRGELTSRMDVAASQYADPAIQSDLGYKFNVASYTKAQCGIAVGYTKKGIVDERSVSNCDCSSNLLATATP